MLEFVYSFAESNVGLMVWLRSSSVFSDQFPPHTLSGTAGPCFASTASRSAMSPRCIVRCNRTRDRRNRGFLLPAAVDSAANPVHFDAHVAKILGSSALLFFQHLASLSRRRLTLEEVPQPFCSSRASAYLVNVAAQDAVSRGAGLLSFFHPASTAMCSQGSVSQATRALCPEHAQTSGSSSSR